MDSPAVPVHPLDDTVHRLAAACADQGAGRPDALFLIATGMELLPEHLGDPVEVSLGELSACPAPWNELTLLAGELGGLRAWLLEDRSGEPVALDPGRPPGPWTGGLPVWLAASCGAGVLVHASAGCALSHSPEGLVPGTLAVIEDHLGFGAENPLTGLAGSRLGPLFPDRSRLHHAGLRAAVLRHAERIGIVARSAVAACLPGPALETPAERRMWASLGADVAVQSLSIPLLAAAHAGLSVLSLVAITDAGDASDVPALLAATPRPELALEDCLLAVLDDLRAAVAGLREETA